MRSPRRAIRGLARGPVWPPTGARCFRDLDPRPCFLGWRWSLTRRGTTVKLANEADSGSNLGGDRPGRRDGGFRQALPVCSATLVRMTRS
jgi:hypothetical protein